MTTAAAPRPVTVQRGDLSIEAFERTTHPGKCATCLRSFDAHDVGELLSCAAAHEETLPTGAER